MSELIKDFEEAIDHLEKIPTHGGCGCITQIRAYVDSLKLEIEDQQLQIQRLEARVESLEMDLLANEN